MNEQEKVVENTNEVYEDLDALTETFNDLLREMPNIKESEKDPEKEDTN